MRSLHEILIEKEKAIREHKILLESLDNEIETIQSLCPHPDMFLNIEHHDSESDDWSRNQYEYSKSVVKCSLCGAKKSSGRYDKRSKNNIYAEWRPTARNIMDGVPFK